VLIPVAGLLAGSVLKAIGHLLIALDVPGARTVLQLATHPPSRALGADRGADLRSVRAGRGETRTRRPLSAALDSAGGLEGAVSGVARAITDNRVAVDLAAAAIADGPDASAASGGRRAADRPTAAPSSRSAR
jgi:hypothetical protein